MPFEEEETFTKHNAEPVAKWVYEFTGHAAKTDGKKPQLHISIPTTVCGVCKKGRFALLIGTGDDAGKVLVRGIEDGSAKAHHIAPSEHQHFLKFNFGYVPKLGMTRFDGGHVPVRRVDDDNFELTVPPSWFEGNEED